MPAPDLPGLITAGQIRDTAAHIADWQLPSGMIPWFPGGHADPWNHIEAAMALFDESRAAPDQPGIHLGLLAQLSDGCFRASERAASSTTPT